MVATATKSISSDVLDVLRRSQCDGELLRLPAGQLHRKLYMDTNKVLESLGGKWNRSKKAHVFQEDAAPLVGDAITAGHYVDAKQLFQFFETPELVAGRLCELAGVRDGMTVLEPSAGKGAIAKVARSRGATVTCFELQQKLADDLWGQGFDCSQADFLSIKPKDDFDFDAVLMNPPFTRSQDIDHVRHALKFLKTGGVLAAVMSPGFTFREDRKAVEFRESVHASGGEWGELPAGTFRASGTNVSTVLVRLTKV